jgi:hypothetical protein
MTPDIGHPKEPIMPPVSKSARERAKEIRSRSFLVYHEGELVISADPFDPKDPYYNMTAEDFVSGELLELFSGCGDNGFDGEDIALWQGGRLCAAIVAAEDGEPKLTLFDRAPTPAHSRPAAITPIVHKRMTPGPEGCP